MKLTVILEDRWTTQMRLEHENEYAPSSRRVVQIQLTFEQMVALQPREVGTSGNKRMYETVRECWIEPDPGAEPQSYPARSLPDSAIPAQKETP